MDATTIHKTRNQVNGMVQAYKEAPWRTQRKWIALVLAGMVAVGMVAALNLAVSSQAAMYGRVVQELETDMSTISLENSDLETKLARLLSTTAMQERAYDMGFEPVTMENVEYLVVPGYYPPAPMQLGNTKQVEVSPALDPRYSQSLFEWIGEQLKNAATQ
jgi:hypothetical protein